MVDITVEEFEQILPEICGPDTTLDSENWTPENPLYGHCAVVSCIAQKLFGGALLRGSLKETPYAGAGSHYLNQLVNGVKDFTGGQFTAGYPEIKVEERGREYVLSFDKTAERNARLSLKLFTKLNGENPLFQDDIYRRCMMEALRSPCAKMGFGAAIVYDGEIVAASANKKIPGLEHLCEPECIRNNIQSRTESMLGACGHAEEWAMKEARDKGVPLNKSVLFVAGAKADGEPYIKEAAEHTCLRCSVQMSYADLKGIIVPVQNHWAQITPDQALRTASMYAKGEKKV